MKTNEDTIRLGGISIGLALNSSYSGSENGISYEEEIPQAQLEKEGKRIADEIVKRLREKEGLADVPIVVGLFKQNAGSSMIPGTYFSSGAAPGGKNSVASWNPINEDYVLFPTSGSDDNYRDIDTAFRNFKQDVEIYFSNYTSVIGTGFYQENELKELKVEIPIQFYGVSEVIGFTQYVTGLVMEHFPENVLIEVSVTSSNGPEALILKKAGETEPFVHIYE
ncbi:CamS family sex pheromone protein [Planococcus halocryophilus]|uniref:CamS family sex pheromone protein n=1 Tax=Planococcus halocryophilus TaxID=1215089 RepID=UPI00034CA42E|nr:CamS family sex pheromone protein [Planococcus halocryophilus]